MARQPTKTKTQIKTRRRGRYTPHRVTHVGWLVRHRSHMARMKKIAENPVHNGHKHKGRDAGAEVMVFPHPIGQMDPEQYQVIILEATKRLGLRSAYSSDLPDMLLEHMAEGGSLEAFCGRPDVGVSHPAFWGWLKLYPELLVAKQVGTAIAQRYWEGIGYNSLFLGEGVKFNHAAWAGVMKTRFGWDRIPEQADGAPEALPDQRHRNLDNLTRQELMDLRDLLAKIELDPIQLAELPPKELN